MGFYKDWHVHVHPEYNKIGDIKDELAKHFDEAVILPWTKNGCLDENEKFEEANSYVLESAKAGDKRIKFIPYCGINKNFEFPANFDQFKGVLWYYLGGGWSWHDAEEFFAKVEKKPLILEEEFDIAEKIIAKINLRQIIIPHCGINKIDDFDLEKEKNFEEGNPAPYFPVDYNIKNLEQRYKTLRDLKKRNLYFDIALVSEEIIKKCVSYFGLGRILVASASPFGDIETEAQKYDKF